MARKSALNHVFCNLLALTLAILLAIAEAEGKGGGKSSSSGSKTTTKSKDKNGTTRCYDEQMNEITCPATNKYMIAVYVISGVVGVILLALLYISIKKKVVGRRRDLKADDRDLGEDKEGQQMFNHGQGGAGKDSDSSNVPPLGYAEKAGDEPKGLVPPVGNVNGSNPSGSAITPQIISFPAPEPAQPNLSSERLMTTHTAIEPLPMPITTPARKKTLADRLKNALKKVKQTHAM